LSKTHNWKSPGSGQIPKYWLKAFPATHSYITKFINTIIVELKEMPDWLTTGIMYLLPKSGDTKELENYRPINDFKRICGIKQRGLAVMTKKSFSFNRQIAVK
jgi:hypothetical protein